MQCPICGTNGIEGGVCFYCEARKKRKKKTPTSEPDKAPRGDKPPRDRDS